LPDSNQNKEGRGSEGGIKGGKEKGRGDRGKKKEEIEPKSAPIRNVEPNQV
jgi:hypothetical protein